MNRETRDVLEHCLGLVDEIRQHLYDGYPPSGDLLALADWIEDQINWLLARQRRGWWARVMRLMGYGKAIVPQVAAVFVRAWLAAKAGWRNEQNQERVRHE